MSRSSRSAFALSRSRASAYSAAASFAAAAIASSFESAKNSTKRSFRLDGVARVNSSPRPWAANAEFKNTSKDGNSGSTAAR